MAAPCLGRRHFCGLSGSGLTGWGKEMEKPLRLVVPVKQSQQRAHLAAVAVAAAAFALFIFLHFVAILENIGWALSGLER